ncbi:MAG: DDE-type integrase/transposase/recombinase [Phycisphaeraceae bacterium]|nr:MAG: DDE-type integrase/transposase/recombinase [Phycisphaeraceae bacterium]
MNRLATSDRVRILACLVEGNSVRATCRMTGFAKGTVLKFVADMGEVCEEYHDRNARDLQATRVQCDEIWSFCYSKEKNVPDRMRGTPGVGDVWTWTALDSTSKFMCGWFVGNRDAECAAAFMQDLAGRLGNRVQLTTDGYKVYERAVQDAFGWQVDYAMLVKQYGEPRDGQARYSPAECIGTHKIPISGRPINGYISTSHVERSNLTMRMGMRRFTRLTNGFSKKFANLRASVAIHFMHYNFCRVHKTLRVTPAMEIGIADHVWELEELVGLLDAKELAPVGTDSNKRGPYKKKAKDSD